MDDSHRCPARTPAGVPISRPKVDDLVVARECVRGASQSARGASVLRAQSGRGMFWRPPPPVGGQSAAQGPHASNTKETHCQRPPGTPLEAETHPKAQLLQIQRKHTTRRIPRTAYAADCRIDPLLLSSSLGALPWRSLLLSKRKPSILFQYNRRVTWRYP